MHHSWFDAQDNMKEWIEASQQHQAWGVRTMTRAFRRQSDRIISTAVHLLIDAWPAGKRERLTVRLGLKNPAGELIHDSELEIEVFPAFDKGKNQGREAGIVGKQGGRAWKLAETLGLKPRLFSSGSERTLAVLVDQVDAYEVTRSEVLGYARNGGRVLFLEQEAGSVWRLEGQEVAVKAMGGKEFVSRKTGHPLVASFQPFDFAYWYDRGKDYIEYMATSYLEGVNLLPILITGKDAQAGDPYPERKVLPVVGELRLGKGSLILSQLKATARVEYEPVAAAFYQATLDRAESRTGK